MKKVTILLVVFLSSCMSMPEKQSASEMMISEAMQGTWFTDTTVMSMNDGKKRDVVRIDRHADGTAYLKGVSIYYKTGKVEDWEFHSKWWCEGDWYVEENDWGKTRFKVKALTADATILFDEDNNMNAPEPIDILEQRELTSLSDLSFEKQLREFLGIY